MNINEIPISILFFTLFILFLLSAFFSGSETALMSLNRYKLKHQAEKGHAGARLAQKLLERTDRLISLILIGNNFVNILITQLATLLGLRLFGDAGLAIATGVLTFLLLVFGEITPKTLAAMYPERVAFVAARVYAALMKVMWPFIWLLNLITNGILSLLGARNDDANRVALSHEELRTVVSSAGTHIPQSHLDMLLRVMDMESITVGDIMIPRSQLLGLNLSDDWNELEEQIINSNFTRLLIYNETLDNVLGFVHLRKLLPLFRDGHLDRERLEAVIRPAYFIPESTSLTQQLLNFREESRRIALVVDEYGEILGLIALEDILEEIVGEFSTTPSNQTREIQQLEDGSYWVDGSMPIREVNRQLGSQFTSEEANTINGLILEYLESIPVPGMTILMNDYPMEIRKTRNNAVKTLIIHPRIQRATTEDDE
ncbi:HlyC/CorC family transporter [Candidatus Thiothrix anitrata]|uniref:HlyC/CorC family transporter n=1 Tax=Candidatus Thiothrix anitrata TaxID=2823902 RepID=A0ABX7X4I1_9GAMM|nr:HlyC/CorC family transporter [Candidatus Thiothrix anitrata]QTR50192.1 HlyC/CorC family transporter [Candidatus Thiothrix anitrata]